MELDFSCRGPHYMLPEPHLEIPGHNPQHPMHHPLTARRHRRQKPSGLSAWVIFGTTLMTTTNYFWYLPHERRLLCLFSVADTGYICLFIVTFFPSVFSVYTDLECCGKSGNWGGCSKSGNFVSGHGKMTCHPSMTLAIKCIRNLPPHLSYVSTLPHITQKWKSYLPLSSVSGSGKNRFWCVRSGCFHHFCGKIK